MSALPAHVAPPPPEPQPLPVRPGLLARLLRLHIRDVAVLGAFIAIFTMALKPVVDNDVFWHLATGRYMWATGRVPHTDPFSWTAFGRAWIAHEWLTEMWLYPLYTHGGYAALMLVFAAVIAAAFVFAYATARLFGASRPFAVGITLLAAVASSHTWGVRPQMLSMLLMALTLWLLTRYATNQSRRLWVLPPLMVLWANLHGGFIFGLGLIGLVAFGRTCEAWWERRARNSSDGYAGLAIATDSLATGTARCRVSHEHVAATSLAHSCRLRRRLRHQPQRRERLDLSIHLPGQQRLHALHRRVGLARLPPATVPVLRGAAAGSDCRHGALCAAPACHRVAAGRGLHLPGARLGAQHQPVRRDRGAPGRRLSLVRLA